MTAQINDTVFYLRREYAIAGINGSGLFDPEEHGISPVMISTACWRGYYCAYQVAEGMLRLKQLHIGLDKEAVAVAKRGEGPILFGVLPRHDDRKWCFVYDGLRQFVPFTGGLLLAAGLIRGLRVPAGFHPAWMYEGVRELIFEQGRVVQEADRSKEMAQIREEIVHLPLRPTDPDKRDEIMKWVENCFSREYNW
jgi:hypothetical protein